MNKINNLFVVFIFSTFINCQISKNETEDLNKIEKIQIKVVDFSIMTFLSVECDKYEKYFKDIKIITITDTVVINDLLAQIVEFELIDSSYSKSVDTRAKIELFSKKDTNIICVGNLTLYMNNKIYKTPNELIELISKIE